MPRHPPLPPTPPDTAQKRLQDALDQNAPDNPTLAKPKKARKIRSHRRARAIDPVAAAQDETVAEAVLTGRLTPQHAVGEHDGWGEVLRVANPALPSGAALALSRTPQRATLRQMLSPLRRAAVDRLEASLTARSEAVRLEAARRIIEHLDGRPVQATVDLTPPRDERPLPIDWDALRPEQREALETVLLATAGVERDAAEGTVTVDSTALPAEAAAGAEGGDDDE